MQNCWTCNGTGCTSTLEGQQHDCWRCEGMGLIEKESSHA